MPSSSPPDPRTLYSLLEQAQTHYVDLQTVLRKCKVLAGDLVAATPALPSSPFDGWPESRGDLEVFTSKKYELLNDVYDRIRLEEGALFLNIMQVRAREISSRYEHIHDEVRIYEAVIDNPEGNASEYICGHRIKWLKCKFQAKEHCIWMQDVANDVVDFLECEFHNSVEQSLVRLYRTRRLSFVDCDFHGPRVTAEGHRKASLRLYGINDSVLRRCRFHDAGSIHINGPDDGYADGSNGMKPIGENYGGTRIQLSGITGSFGAITCPINIGNSTEVSITDSEFTGKTSNPVWIAPDCKYVHVDVVYNGERFQLEQ